MAATGRSLRWIPAQRLQKGVDEIISKNAEIAAEIGSIRGRREPRQGSPTLMQLSRGSAVAWIRLILFGALVASEVSAQIPPEHPDGSGLYATAGVGVVNLESGTGVGVPLGLAVLSTRFRIIGSVTLVDLDFLNDSDPNSRYQRRIDSFGRQVCVDLDLRLVVSEFRCSGGLDLVSSYQADLGIMPAEFLLVAGKPARLYIGLGYRGAKPRTPYGFIGMFFDTPSGRSAGVKLAMGSQYISLGVFWGVEITRFFRN